MPELLLEADAHEGAVNTVAFSPTGDTLVSGGADSEVHLWAVNRDDEILQPLIALRGHDGPVNSIAFSPDGRTLASGSSDQSIRLWDIRHLENSPIILRGHDRWVWSIAFSPDGNTLISGTGYKTIFVWTTRTGILAEGVCASATRNLSGEEWHRFVGEDISYRCTCPDLPPGDGAPDDACAP